MRFDKAYWRGQYQSNRTGWDVGYATPPIQDYFRQLTDKSLDILIPGAGNAYEAEFLFNQGFSNVHILDIAVEPLQAFKHRVPGFPSSQLLSEDFFSHQGRYDVMVEQTFFCALDPIFRNQYVEQCQALLKPEGILLGVLWDVPMNQDRPPFGGSREEYRDLFSSRFRIDILERCYNSIPPRAGREVFVKMTRKD